MIANVPGKSRDVSFIDPGETITKVNSTRSLTNSQIYGLPILNQRVPNSPIRPNTDLSSRLSRFLPVTNEV